MRPEVRAKKELAQARQVERETRHKRRREAIRKRIREREKEMNDRKKA